MRTRAGRLLVRLLVHGRIYGTEIARGLDVFALTPGPQMTENEIAAAALADQGGLQPAGAIPGQLA